MAHPMTELERLQRGPVLPTLLFWACGPLFYRGLATVLAVKITPWKR